MESSRWLNFTGTDILSHLTYCESETKNLGFYSILLVYTHRFVLLAFAGHVFSASQAVRFLLPDTWFLCLQLPFLSLMSFRGSWSTRGLQNHSWRVFTSLPFRGWPAYSHRIIWSLSLASRQNEAINVRNAHSKAQSPPTIILKVIFKPSINLYTSNTAACFRIQVIQNSYHLHFGIGVMASQWGKDYILSRYLRSAFCSSRAKICQNVCYTQLLLWEVHRSIFRKSLELTDPNFFSLC